jgi:hypothetical protein
VKEHPFERVSRAARHYDPALADRQYEESRLAYLLKALRLPRDTARLLKKKNEQETGAWAMSFRDFNETFPTFPVLLGATALEGVKLHLDPRAFLPRWYTNFRGVPFVDFYEDFYEEVAPRAAGRAVGLVFRRNGIRHGMVMMDDQLDLTGMGVPAFVYPCDRRKGRHRLYVAAFQKVAEAIHRGGHGWRP